MSAKGCDLTKTISMSRSRSIYGPAPGTFENVASEEYSINDKVIDTYTTYRMDQKFINTVIRCIGQKILRVVEIYQIEEVYDSSPSSHVNLDDGICQPS